ncbi:nitrite reductase small subunit NirD [Acetobacter lambici]|uniref:Nitrite reductase large subunit NirB n=1 Tax=Acetobacter lambici TaxID=1332824 RepID=A0ABT1F3G7_9PROT|nr:nitrite reductase large subunit NirB [Acetobacter lambici]MCP1243692.1 nitrite reductase large subunit NirB [Acetobacter lambici]MCP1259740.1 nitrite reductase large subunit NirB [Acetobacter lambici]NHO57938.1 nitrite reductase small subunit NirD [Acetobacter lambici]
MTPKNNIIIVGNGMVGHYCAEQLIMHGLHLTHQIHIFGEERHHAYDRVHLTDYMSGQNAQALKLHQEDFHTAHGITLHLSTRITQIDPTARTVATEAGVFPYSSLILATGSRPFVPAVPGNTSSAGLVYRTLEDLDLIRAAAQGAQHGTVIGGGLLGLEAANALKVLGLDVSVIQLGTHLMPAQLDEEGGRALKHRIEALGINVRVRHKTQEILPGTTHRHKLVFADGSSLETDMVVFSAGIQPQDILGRTSGLEVGPRGGIIVDNQCRTSDPNIFAVGECALWEGQIFGLVAPGYTMARTVAALLGGEEDAAFTGADMSTKLKLQGVDVGSIGDAHGREPGSTSYRFIGEADGSYRRLVLSADGKRVTGAVLVGDNSYYDTIFQYVQNGIAPPSDPAALILPRGEGAELLGADALPDTAIICSCHNVTKGSISTAIEQGCTDLAALKQETKASTGCGGCSALLKSVFETELTARGITVDHSLCEHFSYTRQELYSLVRVHNIRSFEELMAQYGNDGLGCDICKPTVGSILASAWNKPITDPLYIPLQDTNDTFMGNMQKNGTYSVVPRIAGGEITPDKLIILGQVAKKYNLYTKITGGQRIDLFGAQLHQLPEIWTELLSAGFETGHAYGKSTRTVKSCVGSTWCRYGVQDSVGKALDLENRYKGLRSPHKLKFAVSGCTRECAEAQSKDVGIIATEHGWNLYVCGNGGMRPRHAELFATDLDSETLVKYIDRFLMFYIRTADKLQRTSVWRENLEGGLDYLKDVIINDSLGICNELEQQMQYVVETYRCEWKDALTDHEKLKRFRTFVNDSRPDPNIRTVAERDQIKPADNQAELPVGAGPVEWTDLCAQTDLVPNSGVVALHDNAQVALFYLPDANGTERVFAVDNHDPFSHANVLGRGLMGDIHGQPVVASPLYKQHFNLEDGTCLEDPKKSIRAWEARLHAGRVEIRARKVPAQAEAVLA